MFSCTLLTAALFASSHFPIKPDTIPNNGIEASRTEIEREANEAQQIFRDHYTAGYYSPYEGPITWISTGTYRFGSQIMRLDSLPNGMMGLLSRGLLYPGLVPPLIDSTDTLSISNLYELKGLSFSPQVRRFSCWVFVTWMVNPDWFVLEITNEHGSTDMDMATFIQGARLTFLYRVSIII
jgi:hypothetical protein